MVAVVGVMPEAATVVVAGTAAVVNDWIAPKEMPSALEAMTQ